MKFADIKGNETAVAALRSMADQGRVPHALLFYENPRSGGLALALSFLQYINCEHHENGDSCGHCPSCIQMQKLSHPDAKFVFPVNTGGVISGDHPVSEQGMAAFRELYAANPYFTELDLYSALGIESKAGNISVWEAREIVSNLALSPVTDGYKAIVMFLPERMNIQAANKLLKILEEPPARTIFLMVTQNPEDVMTTIVSRCQGMRVLPFDRSLLVSADPDEQICSIWDDMMEAVTSGRLLDALECAEAAAALSSREKQRALCVYATEQLRKAFLHGKGLGDIAYGTSKGGAYNFNGAFYTKAVANLDKAAALIARNVSAKIVFTDLVNRLYISLR